MTDYEIILRTPMPASLLERIRKWFAEECPAPWLEVVPDRYALYIDPRYRQVALDHPPSEPLRQLACNPHVALMGEQRIVMVTLRDEATDQALRAFAEWLSTQVEYDLHYWGIPLTPEDLTDPELYE